MKLKLYVLTIQFKDESDQGTKIVVGVFSSKRTAQSHFNFMFGIPYENEIKFRKECKGWWSIDNPIPGILGADINLYRLNRRDKEIADMALGAVTRKAMKITPDSTQSFTYAGPDWFLKSSNVSES